MTATQTLVGIGDICVHRAPGVFTCLGLGSCIGIVAYDPHSGIGGMAHVMLPEAFQDRPIERPGKFADTALPALIEKLEDLGAERARLVLAYAGGARIFRFGAADSRLDVGYRNGQAVALSVSRFGLRVAGIDLGGTDGRSISFCLASGEVRLRTIAGGERLLCNVKQVGAKHAFIVD